MRIKDLETMPDGPMKRRLKAQLAGESPAGAVYAPLPVVEPEAVTQAALGGIKPPLRHKYGAVKTERDGQKFDSKAEARHYDELVLQIAAGEVLFFLRQVPFHFPGGAKYVCDFEVFYTDGHVEFHDPKGVETHTFKLKMKLMKQYYPMVEIKLIK